MKLASLLLLALNMGASTASDKNLRLRGGGEEYAPRYLTLANTTDAPTVSPAPTTYEYEPTVNATLYTPAANTPTSPNPTTSEPTAAPSKNPTVTPTSEPTPSPSQKPTAIPTRKPTAAPTDKPTLKSCSADVLVPLGYYDDYDWVELPKCVREAAAVFEYNRYKWDKGQDSCPSWCDEWFDDLTKEQQWALWVLGYNKRRWNSA